MTVLCLASSSQDNEVRKLNGNSFIVLYLSINYKALYNRFIVPILVQPERLEFSTL